MEKTHIYLKIAVMLAAITILCFGVTVLTAPDEESSGDIVASFYPVYIAAKNVAGDIDGVEVVSLITSQAGCLHDYQMGPRDRVMLESADIFVMNGAGAETVLEPALESLPSLRIIDLSQGQELLENGHTHDHDHDHDHVTASESNSHLWVSPPRYRLQVETLRDELCRLDPTNAARYTANAATYLDKIDAVWDRMKAAADALDDVPTVVFHDSLVYLAEDLELHVVSSLNIGEETTADPDARAETVDALNGTECALFLYDAQYADVPYTDLQSVPARAIVVSVDTCVAGDDDADRWLNAMTAFCEDLEAAA